MDLNTRLASRGFIANAALHTVSLVHSSFAAEILRKYPNITRPSPVGEIKHSVVHHIDTGSAQPVFSRPRRLDPKRMKIAKREFEKLHQQGIIRPSNSPWASPLHMVKKANGDYRPCGDYRRLNAVTKPDRYPLPHLHDFTSYLENAVIYSSIDLLKAYHQVPIAEEDIYKNRHHHTIRVSSSTPEWDSVFAMPHRRFNVSSIKLPSNCYMSSSISTTYW